MHAGEGRIVVGAQATSRVSQGGVLRRPLDRRDVVRVVGQQQFVVGRRVRRHDLDVVEDTERARQPRREVEAHWCHRVVTTEVVCREGVVPDGARPEAIPSRYSAPLA